MRDFRQSVGGIQSGVERWLSIIGGLIVVALMLVSTLDVAMRYLFNSPIDGAYELAEFMLVGMVYLGIAYIQSFKGHVRVDVFVNRVGIRGELLLSIFGNLVGLVAFVLVTWQTGSLALVAWQTGDYSSGLVHLPMWPSKLIIPFGTGLLCLRLLTDLLSDLGALRGLKPRQ